MAEAKAERRWRTFADLVAFALGTNVWVSAVILPAAYVRGGLHGTAHVAAALLPFAVLLLGLARRSDAILLFAFPSALLVPIALQPELAASHVYGPVRFALVAAGLVAYLFGVSFFTTFHEPPAPHAVRPLASAQQGPAVRWQRRERVYWLLTVLSVAVPVVLIAWVNFDPSITEYLGEMYPGRVALMTTALTVGAVAMSLVVYHYVFLGVLRPHRTGDRDLVARLARARADARKGKPRARFYLAVAAALGAMLAILLLRHT